MEEEEEEEDEDDDDDEDCDFVKRFICDYIFKFRIIDGSCNNFVYFYWGMVEMLFIWFFCLVYEDGKLFFVIY